MTKQFPATGRHRVIKQKSTFPQSSPLANLPTELKLMIIRHVHVATVFALLRVNTVFWVLQESLEPELIAAARRLSSLILPKPSVRTFERDRPDDIKDCHNGQCLVFRSDGHSNQSYWTDVRLGRCFRSSTFWNHTEGKPTMSVMVWPKQKSQPGFLSVPELRNPMVFDRGKLCLGYEKCEPESWNLVVRQITDWSLVGKRSLFQGYPYLLDHDSDLIILHSNDGEIHVWNPYLPEPWKLEHAGATIFERPRILPSRTGFVTTSRKSRKNIFEDIQVFVCQSISWQDTEKCPYWELTSYRVPLFSYFPGAETRSYECLRSFTVIWDISRSGILFNRSLIGRIAISYTGEKLGSTLPNKHKIVGEFSDGARVIYYEGRARYVSSYVQVMKNDKVQFHLYHFNDFDGILLFLDTYLVIVDKDYNFLSPYSWLRIFTRAGGLIYEFRLGSEYSTYSTRIFEEGHSIVLYSKDLSEATVWNFGETFPVPSVARSKLTRRANEHPESRYNLRRKTRKCSNN